ncbi:hypothetical protein H072_5645 [Dactylellina haptotyla CBS 200.50]|uniref:Uncharacterized protein n=1 Tax=Dactylellina haptotyla (strain CBS 200.50) TaxID=1284197 RepID=S8BM19_DACHA|nr:hypothetical protein H072_5645 [Dactylellina haptotyla CBS 200.50]
MTTPIPITISLPEYSFELVKPRAVSPTSSLSTESLPKYESVIDSCLDSFHPTRLLQIEAAGHPLVALPCTPPPNPIYIHAVSPTGDVLEPLYLSLRGSRSSNNSVLVRASDPSETPLCSTTYRRGPGKPPKIQLHGAAVSDSDDLDTCSSASAHKKGEEAGEEDDVTITVSSRGITTRAQIMQTQLGTFAWRFASREERRDAAADNLLVLERITTVKGNKQEHRHRVAQLVRNAEFRSAGSNKRTAGNGGRLMLDLSQWADSKGEAEQIEALALASCLVMLKKEVDRRRALQVAVIISVVT